MWPNVLSLSPPLVGDTQLQVPLGPGHLHVIQQEVQVGTAERSRQVETSTGKTKWIENKIYPLSIEKWSVE